MVVPRVVTDVLTFAVLGFMAVRLVTGVRESRTSAGRAIMAPIVRGLRWRHVWPAPLLLVVVGWLAWMLLLVPGLDWGWWSALGGDGNPVFGSSSTTSGTVWEWLVPTLFVVLLIAALPLFAFAEERLFRAGAEGWSRGLRVWKSVQFGLVHTLIGVPIGVAIALTASGAYFMWVYLRAYHRTRSRREATFESARAHTGYNGFIIAVVLVAVLADAIS